MNCVHCGANNPDTAVICRTCGKPVRMTQQEIASSRFPSSRGQQPSRPSAWQSAPQQSFQSPPRQSVPRQPSQPLPRQSAPQQPSQPFARQTPQPSTWQSTRNSAPLVVSPTPATPAVPLTPAVSSTPPRQATQTRETRAGSGRAWLFIVLAGVVILALIIGSVVFFLNHSFIASSNPATQTLTTYCNALKSGDYQTAYAQLASSMKNQLKESDFAYSWQAKKVASCTVDTSSADVAACTSTTCPGSITFFFSDGSSSTDRYQLIQEGGQWKIQSQTGS